MSATETNGTTTATTATTEKKHEEMKGLQVRWFDGEIDQTPEEKDKTKKRILKYKYPRIVFPWSRSGKDVDGKVVEGAVPSYSELIALFESEGIGVEIGYEKGNYNGEVCVVTLLVDGYNRYQQMLQRTKAENTPDSAREQAIVLFMKKTGMNRADAEAFLLASFGGK